MNSSGAKKKWGLCIISLLLIPSVMGTYPEFLNKTGNVVIGFNGTYQISSNGTVESTLVSWADNQNISAGTLAQVSNGLDSAWIVFYENHSVESFLTKEEAKSSLVVKQKSFLDRYVFIGVTGIVLALVAMALSGENNG